MPLVFEGGDTGRCHAASQLAHSDKGTAVAPSTMCRVFVEDTVFDQRRYDPILQEAGEHVEERTRWQRSLTETSFPPN